MRITPVLMSGGVGSRLWPISRASLPKQFHKMLGKNTMFVDTLNRLGDDIFTNPIVVCNQNHRFMVESSLHEINLEARTIILEPVGKNTAPALACVAHIAALDDPDAILLALPSDQHIEDNDAFIQKVIEGYQAAEQGHIVTFGMQPNYPETGYGYIKVADTTIGEKEVHPVERFVEKPNYETACRLIQDETYLWNSGVFLFRAKDMLRELEKFEKELHDYAYRAIKDSNQIAPFIQLNANIFEEIPSISIDNAVMERTTIAAVVPTQCGWSDLGSWDAVAKLKEPDQHGNIFKGPVIANQTKNCFVWSEKDLTVGLVGVEDLSVIVDSDALVICPKDKSQDVKKVVSEMKRQKMSVASEHRRVYRPWGWYESIDEGTRFKVKHIFVNPGASLSLQLHHHRAEHWVVVSGTAHVTRGTKEQILTENESIYVPVGELHRLENKGIIPLRIVEVQTGSYLGEDDIVRLEDKYARSVSD